MLENSLTGEPPSCGVATRGRIGTTIRQMAHPSSRPNLDKSDIKYLTPLAIPGWATTVAIGIVVITFQAILLLTLLTFLVLNYRSSKLFIPAKDYRDYFLTIERLI